MDKILKSILLFLLIIVCILVLRQLFDHVSIFRTIKTVPIIPTESLSTSTSKTTSTTSCQKCPQSSQGQLLRGRSEGTFYTTNSIIVSNGNSLVKSGAFRLEGIILGSDTTSNSNPTAVALWDSATAPALGNPFSFFQGSTLHGFYKLGVDIVNGLVATVTNETGVTVIWGLP